MAAKLGASGRRRLGRALVLRDGDVCHYCRIELTDETRSLDHVVPLVSGGSNEQSNLVLACKRCNFLKDDTPYQEFWEMRSWLGNHERLTQQPFAQIEHKIYPRRDAG